MFEISETEKVIDSRDIIKRLEELTEERSGLRDGVEDAKKDYEESATERTDLKDILLAAEDELESWDEDNLDELEALEELDREASSSPDWLYGETLIHESHFVEYAQELAEEVGAVSDDTQWPLRHIDWEAAAEELKVDYMEVNYNGETFYIRA